MNLNSFTAPTLDTATALAVRYRPRSFATIVGQKHVIGILRHAIKDRTVPQQILFSGGSGLGKTTIARVLSAALLCSTQLEERTNSDACGKCQSCLDVLTPSRSHPDLIEFDAASNGGKDEIRDIAQRAQLAPMIGPVKIYIIDEAHGLSGAGGQAFLKLLEEPPSHVIFMLCTTDPQKMLKTNRGRCVEFELSKPSNKDILENLKRICSNEGWVVKDDILEKIIEITDPDLGVRGTIMNLAKITGPLILGNVIDDDLLDELLGVPSDRLVKAVFDAIDAADPLLAIDSVSNLRANSSEAMVRNRLISYARKNWLSKLQTGPAEREMLHYKMLAEASNGEVWTDLVVVLLTRPALMLDNTTASVLVTEAEELLDTLTSTIADARIAISTLEQSNRTARSFDVNAKYNKKTEAKGTGESRTKVKPASVTGPGRVKGAKKKFINDVTLPGMDDSESENSIITNEEIVPRLSKVAAQLISASAPAPATLANYLSHCNVSIEADNVVIIVPVSFTKQTEHLKKVLEKATSRMGYELDLREE